MDSDLLTRANLGDTHRHHLLWVLACADDVHRMSRDDGQLIGVVIRKPKLHGPGLRSGVGIARVVAVILRVSHTFRGRPEDLISREIQELFTSGESGEIEDIAGSDHVIEHKFHGFVDGSIDVSRGRQDVECSCVANLAAK